MTKIQLSKLSYETIEKNQNKKVKAASNITLRAPLKEIPNEYWDKVEVGNDWDREYVESENARAPGDGTRNFFSGGKGIPMMYSRGVDGENGPWGDGPWDRRFKNWEVLNNFKKYVDENKSFAIITNNFVHADQRRKPMIIRDIIPTDRFRIHYPSRITKMLKDERKMFVDSNGYGRLREIQAFEFLKSIINSYEIKSDIKFTPGQEFTLGDWDKHRTSVWDEIEVTEQEAREWQQCNDSSHKQLEQQVTQLQTQNQQSQQTITNLNQQVNQFQSQVNQLNQQIQDKDKQITSLNNQISEKDKKLTELQTANEQLKQEIASLKVQEKQCQIDKDNLQQELTTAQELLKLNQEVLENSGLSAITEVPPK